MLNIRKDIMMYVNIIITGILIQALSYLGFISIGYTEFYQEGRIVLFLFFALIMLSNLFRIDEFKKILSILFYTALGSTIIIFLMRYTYFPGGCNGCPEPSLSISFCFHFLQWLICDYILLLILVLLRLGLQKIYMRKN
jgi:hypothetical protein